MSDGADAGIEVGTGRPGRRTPVRLPDFPWDTIAAARTAAAAHPDGIVDLSVGTPVDPVAAPIRAALAARSDFGGYPTTIGTPALRAAAAAALVRRYGSVPLEPGNILPVLGTKEAIASLPQLLGLGAGHTVVIPEVAYPTYEVAGLLAGAAVLRADSLTAIGPQRVALMFINSPSNPTGKVLGIDHLRKVVEYSRRTGTIIAADECYLGLAWEGEAISILDPRVNDGDLTNLLAIHSLSKTSNLASYRAGFLAGDRALIAELGAVRKHAGLVMPFPVQTAMTYALEVDEHEAEQRERYASRRAVLLPAVRAAGFVVDDSIAGLYLWARRGDSTARELLDILAGNGILVAPGDFYGPRGNNHVRIALTATDERIAAAAQRLCALG